MVYGITLARVRLLVVRLVPYDRLARIAVCLGFDSLSYGFGLSMSPTDHRDK
jgi:hypothetical protein